MIDQRMKELDSDQAKAILQSFNSHTLVLSSPGSGKTRTLQTRYLYLVEKLMVDPKNIMVLTFTNKAAKELKERILRDLPNLKFNNAFVGTFHGICVRLLQSLLPTVTGEPTNFTIIDEADSKKLVREAFDELLIEGKRSDISECLDEISKMKADMISPPDAFKIASTDRQQDFAHVYLKYQEYLKVRYLMDFDELILYTIEQLEKLPLFRTIINKKFKYILTDESQDTSKMQYRLLKLMLGTSSNLFMVADADQGIYSWRGASPETFNQIDKMFNGIKIIELGNNYRSTKSIVNAADAVIQNNIARFPKSMATNNVYGTPIELYVTDDRLKEARLVASRIKQLSSQFQYKDIAILYRTNDISRNFEEALMSMQIPYEVIVGCSFYQRKEIKDMMCLIRTFHSLDDHLSLQRVLSMIPNIGESTIKKIQTHPLGIIEGIKSIKGKAGAILINWLDKIQLLKAKVSTKQLDLYNTILTIYKELYAPILLDYDNYQERVANVESFINISIEYESNYDDNTLDGFVNFLLLYSAQDELTNNNTVKLITGHGSKGLEWPVVFIVAVNEDIIPHSRSILDKEIEEERRLFYVMMTRAKSKLILSYSKTYRTFKGPVYAKPSRFIKEIPPHLYNIKQI